VNAKHWLLFLSAALFWGASWSAAKLALAYVPPLNFSAQQFLLSTLVLLPLLIVNRRHLPTDRKTVIRLLVYSLINAMNIAVTNVGLQYESSGTSAMLTFTQPLIVFGLSIWLFHAKVRLTKVLGVVIGFVGVTVLSLKGSGVDLSFSSASLLLIGGAFFWALSTVFYKKYLNHVNRIVVTTAQFAVGCLVLFSFGGVFEGFPVSTDPLYLGILAYMAVVPTVMGSMIWLYLLSREDATELSTYGFITPIMAMLFGWWLLDESVTVRAVLGVVLIIVGVYLVQKRRRQGVVEQPLTNSDSSAL
jgi:drug/metabolite transporter (DMT)-like permease